MIQNGTFLEGGYLSSGLEWSDLVLQWLCRVDKIEKKQRDKKIIYLLNCTITKRVQKCACLGRLSRLTFCCSPFFSRLLLISIVGRYVQICSDRY